MNPLLRITNLSKHYPDFTLESLNLEVEPGMIVGLIGTNGAGKTTTLKAALGLITPDSGSIELLGQPLQGATPTLDEVKQSLGVVLDSCSFPRDWHIKDVGTVGRISYTQWDEGLWQQLCERFELLSTKTVADLSRGMGMKLSLAFALAHHPRLLILDEATAGLDPMARDEVLECLRDYMEQNSCAILMSTHITTDLEKLADWVACIDHGRLQFNLPKEAITDEAGVARLTQAEWEQLAQNPPETLGEIRYLKQPHWVDVLVTDRRALASLLPQALIERATIEEYMTLSLKGATL